MTSSDSRTPAGPRCRFIRERDRATNDYPSLYYPEMYILKGGYKEFFPQHPVPQAGVATVFMGGLYCRVVTLRGRRESYPPKHTQVTHSLILIDPFHPP